MTHERDLKNSARGSSSEVRFQPVQREGTGSPGAYDLLGMVPKRCNEEGLPFPNGVGADSTGPAKNAQPEAAAARQRRKQKNLQERPATIRLGSCRFLEQ